MAERVRVAAVGEIASGHARRVEVGGVAVCVVRIDDTFHAIGDVCSHGDYSLSEGPVWADDGTIESPKHGSAFSLTTGRPMSLPAIQPVPVFVVTVTGDDVTVAAP